MKKCLIFFLLFNSIVAFSQTYDSPITITKGGVYSGNWESQDPLIPAITIQTTEPVIIENSLIRSRGHLISTGINNVDITIRNSFGFGLNPNEIGKYPGRFFNGSHVKRALIENNYLEGTSGIYFLKYGGNGTIQDTYKIRYNKVKNIDGRMSNGNGGFLDFNTRRKITSDGLGTREDGFKSVQFVQLNQVKNIPDVEIAWNEVINEAYKSRVEDNINIFRSTGSKSNPILIHNNFISGAYTIKPELGGIINDGIYEYSWKYSGGGILLGDGSGNDINELPAHIRGYDNQVVSTTNYGIAIYSGNDIQYYNNRILSSGYLEGGEFIQGQNIGIYVWNGSKSEQFSDNFAYDNHVGWVYRNDTEKDSRNDSWFPDCSRDAEGNSLCINNTRYPNPIAYEMEQEELDLWNNKVKMNKKTIGPIVEDLTSITHYLILTPDTLYLEVDSKLGFQLKIEPIGAVETGIIWFSHNNSIATVDADGIVTGIAEGTTTVSVSSESGLKATATVIVNAKKVSQKPTKMGKSNKSFIKIDPEGNASENHYFETIDGQISELNLSENKNQIIETSDWELMEFTADKRRVFPNPSMGEIINIMHPNLKDSVIELINFKGINITFNLNNINHYQSQLIPHSRLSKGVYLIVIKNSFEFNSLKLIVN